MYWTKIKSLTVRVLQTYSKLNELRELLISFTDLESQDFCNFSPRVGDFCCAKFSADGGWYRSLVLRSGDLGEKDMKFEVFYIDFGNIEQVNIGDLRELLPQFMVVPAQIVRCSLADVNPSIKQEFDGSVFDGKFCHVVEGVCDITRIFS